MRKNEVAKDESQVNKKKILILMNGSFALFKFKRELISELNDSYEVILVFPFNEFTDQLEEISTKMINLYVDRRGKNIFTDFEMYKNLFSIMKNEKPDMVLAYTIKMNIYGGFICQYLSIPYILNITGLGSAFNNKISSSFFRLLYKIASIKAEFVFFQNIDNYKSFVVKIIQKEKAVLVNGSGVNLEEFMLEAMIDNETTTFTFIGRVMKDKGIDEFIEAAKIINSKHKNTYFQIIGKIEDIKYTEIMRNISGIGIRYLGFSEEIKEFVKKSDCIINPSYHEGLSNVLLEAAAMGRPLLATDIPGCKEVVNDGYNGYLFSRHSTESLVLAIEKFLELDFEKRKVFGENSRELVARRFDRKKVNEVYIVKIREILGERSI